MLGLPCSIASHHIDQPKPNARPPRLSSTTLFDPHTHPKPHRRAEIDPLDLPSIDKPSAGFDIRQTASSHLNNAEPPACFPRTPPRPRRRVRRLHAHPLPAAAAAAPLEVLYLLLLLRWLIQSLSTRTPYACTRTHTSIPHNTHTQATTDHHHHHRHAQQQQRQR